MAMLKGGIYFTVFGLALAGLGFSPAFDARSEIRDRQLLEREGETVGVLPDVCEWVTFQIRSALARNDRHAPEAKFRVFYLTRARAGFCKDFEVDEQWRGQFSRTKDISDQKVLVRYLPADPSRVFLVGTAPPSARLEFVGYGLALGGLALALAGNFGKLRKKFARPGETVRLESSLAKVAPRPY